MRKFLAFLLVLAIIAGGAYVWWQRNAQRIVAARVQRIAQRFFVNPDRLEVGPKHLSIQMLNLHSARVPELVIYGKNLQLRDGPELASARLVLRNVEVNGPPFHIASVGSGAYTVAVTDDAVTSYLHQRKGKVVGMKLIPLDSISVEFAGGKLPRTVLHGETEIPIIKQRVPITSTGRLIPSNSLGQVDFRVESVSVQQLSIGVKDAQQALGVVNPVVDLSSWPVSSQITNIKTSNGLATLSGKITGANTSLLSL